MKQHRGILIIEVILAIAVFVVFASGAIYFLAANLLTAQAVQRRAQAMNYMQEGVEAVQSIDRLAWNYLADSPDNTYGLKLDQGVWTLTAEPDHPGNNPLFTRTVTIADVYRDTSGDIVTSSTINAVMDPHTRQVTVTIEWVVEASKTSSLATTVYVTDWDASSLVQDTTTDFAQGKLNNLRISNIDDGELQIIQPTMELGTVTASTTWKTITLNKQYTQAVVITSLLDDHNPNSPVTTRVRNVTSTSFDVELSFPKDNTIPKSTNDETVYYLVIEAGTWTLGDGATKLEAGVIKNVAQVNCSTCGSWNKGVDVSYQQTYSSNPLVFHQVVTANDDNWITSFASDDTSETSPPGTDGFQLALNGAEVTSTHAPENIAYMVIAGEVTDQFEGAVFETDRTGNTLRGYSEPHRTENFDQTYGTAPWVAVTQFSMNNTDGSWAMLDSVTTKQIALYVDEDQTLDAERSHPTEYGGYMAFASAGTYYLNDAAPIYDTPPMEVGKITSSTTGYMEVGSATVDTNWSTVTLKHTYTKPVVVASILGVNNPSSPVSVRVRNAAGASFQVHLDFPPDHFAPRSTNNEKIYYLVVEAGIWTLGDGQTKLEAGLLANVARVNCATCGSWNNGVDVSYHNGYTAPPIVLHQVMSANDASWITSFASDDTSATTPPGTDGFQLALNGAEVTSTHAPEDIGYVVIASEITDSATGVKFETDGTGDIVQGYMDKHYRERFDQTYDAPPLVIASQITMDGIAGSWAMLGAVTSKDVTMYVDEDQAIDPNRWHTTEDVGYATFAAASDFVLTDQTFLQNPVTITLKNAYINPVIITTPYFTNDVQSPASIRVSNVTGNSFTAKLDAPTDKFTPTNTNFSDDVYYLAIEAGQWQIGDMKVEAGVNTISTVGSSSGSWTGTTIPFDQRYGSPPIVLHQVMSNQDTNWISSFVTRAGDRTNPPTTTAMALGLNAAEVTTSVTHGAEQIGWVALANVGTSSVAGTEFRTMWSDEFAGGHDDGCFRYGHGGNYTQPMMFVTQMSMDSTDGSWPSLCAFDASSLSLHFEEDEFADVERSHPDEAVGMLIFQQPFVLPGTVNTSNQTSGTYESPVLGDGSQRNFNIIEWAEQVACPNCAITVQLRTGATVIAVASASYVGPDGTTASYFTAGSGDLLSLNTIGQPYIQYFMTVTGTTAQSPILEDVTLSDYEQ